MRSVVPIHFVAIVFGRIVRGRHHNTTLATQLPDGKREFGGGAQCTEQIHVDTVSRENIGHEPGKFRTHPAAVVGNRYANILAGKGCLYVVGQSLRGCPNGVTVHSVGANANNAPKPTRTKFQRTVERVGQFGGVASVLKLANGGFRIVVVRASQPAVDFGLGCGVDGCWGHAAKWFRVHESKLRLRQWSANPLSRLGTYYQETAQDKTLIFGKQQTAPCYGSR